MTQLQKSFAIVTLTLILVILFACVKSYTDSRLLLDNTPQVQIESLSDK